MKRISRRALLTTAPLGGLALLLGGQRSLRAPAQGGSALAAATATAEPFDPLSDEGARPADELPSPEPDPLDKIRDFDRTYPDDYLLDARRLELLHSVAARLERAVSVIGHGRFNLVSFDELRRYATHHRAIGELPRNELDFLEEIFHADARRYGFLGDKVLAEQTHRFDPGEVEKIPASGHYLLRGEPLAKYRQIRRDVGEGIFLTSGVRGVVKQYQLFLSKAVRCAGNLSQAARSLAPPGYSYHAVGDFDVGRVGFGLSNFTAEFAQTEEYRKLIDLGYVSIRYTETNPFGVRHEPWHIKIA